MSGKAVMGAEEGRRNEGRDALRNQISDVCRREERG